MIILNDKFRIDVNTNDDGETCYYLYDYWDEIIHHKYAGSAYTSSEEGMQDIGETLIAEYEKLIQ